eukprot:5847993-Pyramimonas_sp.AAC.1
MECVSGDVGSVIMGFGMLDAWFPSVNTAASYTTYAKCKGVVEDRMKTLMIHARTIASSGKTVLAQLKSLMKAHTVAIQSIENKRQSLAQP